MCCVFFVAVVVCIVHVSYNPHTHKSRGIYTKQNSAEYIVKEKYNIQKLIVFVAVDLEIT